MSTSRTFSVRSNAIRNARLTFGKSAKEGVEFSVAGTKDTGFTWTGLVEAAKADEPKPLTVEFMEAANAPHPVKPAKKAKAKVAKKKAKVAKKKAKVAKKFLGPLFRNDSKMQKLVRMIAGEKGASLNSLVKALGWQKHTIRGRISTIRSEEKINIKSYKDDNRGRVYQIA